MVIVPVPGSLATLEFQQRKERISGQFQRLSRHQELLCDTSLHMKANKRLGIFCKYLAFNSPDTYPNSYLP